jgi:CDP-diacylglycerol--glycerol-3-phosphate 3-phosphatidyltransferase
MDSDGHRLVSLSTLPNLLSCCRIVMAPVLLVLAATGRPGLFLLIVMAAFITDAADGAIARRIDRETRLGAKLDSWGDFGIYAGLAIGAWWLWPDIVRREAPFFVMAVASYFVPVAFGFLRYGRHPSHHTWGAKVSVVLMSVSVIILFAGFSAWPFRCCAPLFVLAGIEDMLITAVLPESQSDVRSLHHAMRIRQEKAQAKR